MLQGIVVVVAAAAAVVVGCIVAVGQGRFAVQQGFVVAGNLKVVVAIADILVVADCNLQWLLVCVNSAACD